MAATQAPNRKLDRRRTLRAPQRPMQLVLSANDRADQQNRIQQLNNSLRAPVDLSTALIQPLARGAAAECGGLAQAQAMLIS